MAENVNVGTAYVDLQLNKSGFDSDLRNLQNQAKNAAVGVEQSWLKVGAAMGIAQRGVDLLINQLRKIPDTIRESTMLATRVETLGVVLEVVGRNAGYSKAEMEGYALGVKKMGITTQESMQSVTRMTQAHIDLADSQNLARIAQDAAVIGNTNSSDALGRMIHGIQTGQTEVLRTIGINVQFEQGYAKLAKQLDKTTEALTMDEKMQARVNLVMEQGKNIAGAYEASMGTAGKMLSSMARLIEDSMLGFGEIFRPTFASITKEIYASMVDLERWFAEKKASGEIKKWGDSLLAVFNSIRTTIDYALVKPFKLAITVIDELKGAILGLTAALAIYYTTKIIGSIAVDMQAFIWGAKMIASILWTHTIPALIAAAAAWAMTPWGMITIGLVAAGTALGFAWNFAAKEQKKFDDTLKEGSDDAIRNMIKDLEDMRDAIYLTGGFTQELDDKIKQLYDTLDRGRSSAAMWKGIVHYGDIGGAKPAFDPAQQEAIEKKLKKEIETMNLSPAQMIAYQAKEYLKQAPGSADVINKWVGAKMIEINRDIVDKTKELYVSQVESERKHAEDLIAIHTKQKQDDYDIEVAYKNKLADYLVKTGGMTREEALKQKAERDIAGKTIGRENIAGKMGMFSGIEYTAPEGYDDYIKQLKEIENIKKFLELDLASIEFENREKELDYQVKIAEVQLNRAERERTMPEREIIKQRLDLLKKELDFYKQMQDASAYGSEVWIKWRDKINEVTRATEELKTKQKELMGTFEEGVTRGFLDYYAKMKTAYQFGMQYTEETAKNIKSSFSEVLMDLKNNETKSFLEYFQSFSDRMLDIWIDMLSEMMANWVMSGEFMKSGSTTGASSGAGGILGGLMSLGMSLFGGGGSTATGAYYTMTEAAGNNWAAYYHGGGIVGKDRPAAIGIMPSYLFANAPRYHSGNEKAAILTDDEGVFTSEQMKALGKGKGENANITYIEIKAVDSKSFADMVNRNSDSIVTVVNSALKGQSSLRETIRRTR